MKSDCWTFKNKSGNIYTVSIELSLNPLFSKILKQKPNTLESTFDPVQNDFYRNFKKDLFLGEGKYTSELTEHNIEGNGSRGEGAGESEKGEGDEMTPILKFLKDQIDKKNEEKMKKWNNKMQQLQQKHIQQQQQSKQKGSSANASATTSTSSNANGTSTSEKKKKKKRKPKSGQKKEQQQQPQQSSSLKK